MRFALLFTLMTMPALAQGDFSKPFPGFRIVGNLYYVGTWDLASYLITTPQGNILINTGLADSVPMILANVENLGFKFSDIKILMATHAHFDHVAGMAEIRRLTGARLLIGEGDLGVLESGGKTDYLFADDPGKRFEGIKADATFKDGDHVTLGGTIITAHHHPGHTKGATSFSLNVADGGATYRVLIANMGSINPGTRVSGMPTYPAITADYARTFHDQKELKFDIFLASHASQFDMHEKYHPGDAYNPKRFVDPKQFLSSVEQLEKVYREQLAREQAAAAK